MLHHNQEAPMKVEAVMAAKGREVATIHPIATLATVAQRLRLENIGALVVLEGDRLAGMISERGELCIPSSLRASGSLVRSPDQAARSLSGVIGSSRIRRPVAWNTALATA